MRINLGWSTALFLVLFSLPILIPWAPCQAYHPSEMRLNSTLQANRNETLVSPNGVYEMGFYVGRRTSDSESVYTLAIWFAQTTPKTVVWMANRFLNLSYDATLLLSQQGELQVFDTGNLTAPPLWISTPTNATQNLQGRKAMILDSGNLILYDQANQTVWQSFDSPTDTLLVAQNFTASANVTMFSWQNNGNWMPSRYSLAFTHSYLNASWECTCQTWSPTVGPGYWYYATPFSSVVLTAETYFLGTSNDSTWNSTIIGDSTNAVQNNRLLRITFDVDGNLRMYSWLPGSSNKWDIEWQTMTDTCHIYNFCGPYSICNNSQCSCPPGFQYIDATQPSQGCARRIPMSLCNSSSPHGNLVMNSVNSLDYPNAGDYLVLFNKPLDACIQTCLDSCFCLGFALSQQDANGTYTCWFKKEVLLNGQITNNRIFYMRIVETPHNQIGPSIHLKLVLVSATLGSTNFILGVVSCILGTTFAFQKRRGYHVKRLEAKWKLARGLPLRFSYEDIQVVTNNFDEEIGKEDHALVFKGDIGSLAAVIVKRLDNLNHEQGKEFIDDVDTIGRIHHFNLVHLHGYCTSEHQNFLVHEYLDYIPLDKLLFHHKKTHSPPLEWRSRFKIALETARGLAHLHEEVQDRCIIHYDIRAENICIDSNLSAKISNLEISRITNREHTRPTTSKNISVSSYYLAPEWSTYDQHVPITAKIDVYSFGMVLLELVSGRRNVKCFTSVDQLEEDWYFPLWAYPKLHSEAYLEVVDPLLGGIVNSREVKTALSVAFWCINEEPDVRPSMSEVVQLLEGHSSPEFPVPQPNFLVNEILFKIAHEFEEYSRSTSPLILSWEYPLNRCQITNAYTIQQSSF